MKSFLNTSSDGKVMIDRVFKAAVAAKEDEIKSGDIVVNATLGTLFDEDQNFVAFKSVWNAFKDIEDTQKAKYASSIQGNIEYRESIYRWLFSSIDEEMKAEIIATPGGAGAISSTLKNMLDPGEIAIKPSLGWGPYKTMAAEFGIKLLDYNMFNGNKFDIESFKEVTNKVMKEQGKVLVIINDPCHNPTGYTLTGNEWDQIIEHANILSENGPFIIINDIAYIDFNMKGNDWKKHFKKFNHLAENVMAIIAFSTSKTLTAYGARAGAQIVITKNEERLNDFKNAAIYSARSIWSTVSNGAMSLFAKVESNEKIYNEYIEEKQYYVNLLKERSAIFLRESKENSLDIYPYKEGFFITIKVEDKVYKEAVYNRLMENHIYTVMVDGGLRVALCSVPKRKLVGLAKKIKDCM